MAFKDLGDWAEIGGLKLPINGKVYTVLPVDAELGPRVQALVSAGIHVELGNELTDDDREVLDDLAERKLYQEVLGPAYDEMIANGVQWAALKHAAMTVMIDAAIDRATAERFWEQPQGKPAARKPTDRKPKSSARSATASRTTRASTAGTTTPDRPPRRAASTTRGPKSSNAGS